MKVYKNIQGHPKDLETDYSFCDFCGDTMEDTDNVLIRKRVQIKEYTFEDTYFDMCDNCFDEKFIEWTVQFDAVPSICRLVDNNID